MLLTGLTGLQEVIIQVVRKRFLTIHILFLKTTAKTEVFEKTKLTNSPAQNI